MTMTITISNDGPRIVASNFWESDYNARQRLILSPNAGTFRLLIPRGLEDIINEAHHAHEIVISRGPWSDEGDRDAFEILLDDDSADPFAIHLVAEQCIPLPAAEDGGKWYGFSMWAAPRRKNGPRMAFNGRCFFRLVPQIPWIQPRE